MKPDTELFASIARLRRQTTNRETLDILDALEELLKKRAAERKALLAPRKMGRPLGGAEVEKPWLALGLSRRTWFRRRAAEKGK